MVAGSVLSMATPAVFAAEPSAEPDATANSKVMAEVETGGLHLDITGNGQDGSGTAGATAKDVDFGTLKINDEITPVTVPGLATITDHTGAQGWDLNVKTDNYAEVKDTLKVNLAMDKTADMTDAASLMATGESQLAAFVKDGTFSAEWGTKPEAKTFSQALTWTLSAKAGPQG